MLAIARSLADGAGNRDVVGFVMEDLQVARTMRTTAATVRATTAAEVEAEAVESVVDVVTGIATLETGSRESARSTTSSCDRPRNTEETDQNSEIGARLSTPT